MNNLFSKCIMASLALSLTLPAMARRERTSGDTIPKAREVQTKREFRPHIGLLYGLLMPEGNWDNTDSLGVDIGFQPYIPFGLGLEFTTTNLEHENGYHFNRNDLLAKASYHFGGDNMLLRHSYLGLGLGASMNPRSTEMVTAPLLGFDVPLAHEKGECYFSLGANAKYSIYTAEQPDALTANAVLKFWF